MSLTRILSADLFAAIRAGDLSAIKNYVTAENINDNVHTKDDAKFTLLTFAAYHDRVEIVDYLLKEQGMDLRVNQQGRRVLKVTLDKQHSRTLVRLLAEKTLVLQNGNAIIPVTDVTLCKNLHKKLPARLYELFKNLAAYQAMFYITADSNFDISLNKIERIQIIADCFAEFGYEDAAQQWLEMQALEVIHAGKKYNLYKCPEDRVNSLVTAMMNVIEIYKIQASGAEKLYKVSKNGAYIVAVLLGMLDYVEKFKIANINYKKYFHTAYSIANTVDFNVGEEQGIQMKFLRAYVQTHTDGTEELQCLNNNRLSKHLEHLALLREVREFNPTQIIFRAQRGYAATLLTQDIISNNKDRLVRTGLELFYGIETQPDFAAAAEKFKEAALLFKKVENVKKLEVFILSLMAQHRNIQKQNDRLYSINMHQYRALMLLNDMLPLYNQDIALEHEIEIFALLFDLLKCAPRNHDKILVLNQLLKFLIKISQYSVYTKKHLVDYIFDEIVKSEILKDEELVIQVVKMIEICLHQASSAFNWKQIFNKWETLINEIDAQPGVNTQLKFTVVMGKLQTLPLYFRMDSPYLNYNEIIYADAIHCMEILPALAKQAGIQLDLQPYSWIYYDYANLQSFELERDKYYFKAINLRSTAALMALMALPSEKKYEVGILQGLQNAITTKDVRLIAIINKYLSNPDQEHYSPQLLERSMRALRFSDTNSYVRPEMSAVISTHKTEIEMTVITARQGFIHVDTPALSSIVSSTNLFHAPGR